MLTSATKSHDVHDPALLGRNLKNRLPNGELLIGGMLSESARPSLVKLYCQAGFDFLLIENEHVLFSPTDLVHDNLSSHFRWQGIFADDSPPSAVNAGSIDNSHDNQGFDLTFFSEVGVQRVAQGQSGLNGYCGSAELIGIAGLRDDVPLSLSGYGRSDSLCFRSPSVIGRRQR